MSRRLVQSVVVASLMVGSVVVAHGEGSAAVPPRATLATIAGGVQHSLVLKEDGTLWTFGRNKQGQLGHATNVGTDDANVTPTQVLTGVVAVAAGRTHSMALKADGTLWTFGGNQYGQLGNATNIGTTVPNPTPTQVMTNVAAIAAGYDASYALKTDGTLWAFGHNYYGQLGTATNSGVDTSNSTPVQVLTGVAAIAGGGYHALAVKTDGTVWSFGRNNYGQLGRTENILPNPTPTAIVGLANVVSVAAGDSHSMVLKDDGTVWVFGYDGYGQLGDGTTSGLSPNPTPTQTLTGVISIAASNGDQGFAIKADGTLWSFGYNQYGHLGHTGGNGGSSGQPTPTQVLSNVAEVAPGYAHTLALKTDGTLWTFGATNFGQTAQTPIDVDPHPTPTQVLAETLQPETYVSLVPGRLMDTRVPASDTVDDQYEGIGLRTAGSTSELTVLGRAGVPLDAKAVALNVTVTGAQGSGYITVYPCGSPKPNASNLNFVAGDTIPNLVISKLGKDGLVCFYTETATHLIVDVAGFYPATSTYTSLVPGRLLDTRNPGGQTVDDAFEAIGVRAAGSTTELVVGGRGGVPDDAVAAVLNVTVIGGPTGGYITVYPCGSTQPNTSNLNFNANQTIPNLVMTKIGVDKKVCLFTERAANLIVDVDGYYPISSTFISLNPARLIDSRVPASDTVDDLFEAIGVRAAGSTTELQVTGRGGVLPFMGTVVLNVTVTGAQAGGYLTVYPCGATQPNASNLNYDVGETIPNLVVSKVGTDGKVCIFTSAATNVIADVSGYYGTEVVVP